jgi:8-oxo-dGTP pyrophosphatase MutT (NUDIX family)
MPKRAYHVYDNKEVYAGGVLLYDDDSIYCIKENRYLKNTRIQSCQYIDPGGKFESFDRHIFQTMAREFVEETYLAIQLDYFTLLRLVDDNKVSLVWACIDDQRRPHYLCALLHVKWLDGFVYDPDAFLQKMTTAKQNCKNANPYHYTSVEFVRIHFDDIKNTFEDMHERLQQILLGSFLAVHIDAVTKDKLLSAILKVSDTFSINMQAEFEDYMWKSMIENPHANSPELVLNADTLH